MEAMIENRITHNFHSTRSQVSFQSSVQFKSANRVPHSRSLTSPRRLRNIGSSQSARSQSGKRRRKSSTPIESIPELDESFSPKLQPHLVDDNEDSQPLHNVNGAWHSKSPSSTLGQNLDVERLLEATRSLEDIIHKALPLALKTYVSLALVWQRLAAHQKYLQRTTILDPYVLIECWSETHSLKRDLAIKIIALRSQCLEEGLRTALEQIDTGLFKNAVSLDNMVVQWTVAATDSSEQASELHLHAFDCHFDHFYELCRLRNNQFNDWLPWEEAFDDIALPQSITELESAFSSRPQQVALDEPSWVNWYGPFMSDERDVHRFSSVQDEIDDSEGQVDKSLYVQNWILQVLRSSTYAANRFFEGVNRQALSLSSDELQNLALKCWFQDETYLSHRYFEVNNSGETEPSENTLYGLARTRLAMARLVQRQGARLWPTSTPSDVVLAPLPYSERGLERSCKSVVEASPVARSRQVYMKWWRKHC
jgi:hypothetical protein